jgi:hypothetical protein
MKSKIRKMINLVLFMALVVAIVAPPVLTRQSKIDCPLESLTYGSWCNARSDPVPDPVSVLD